MKHTNDNWITIIGLGILLLEQFVTGEGLMIPGTKQELIIMSIHIITIVVIWMTNLALIKNTRKKYPGIRQSGMRFLYTSIICLAVSYILNFISILIFKYFIPDNQRDLSFLSMVKYLGGVAIILWMICGMYEAGYFQSLLRAAQKEKNNLLNLQMQQQLNNLKDKVNPHFLFNSLNTISALIYSNPEKAEQFVEELSTVYRYLLQNEDDNLCTLEKEIKFIRTYFVLLGIRFSEGLKYAVEVADDLLQHKLPRHSLQILVDNAIHYNIISREKPLSIYIYTENEKLFINNNLQRKYQLVPSERSGLNHIISNFSFAGRTDITIKETGQEFIVAIPLLPPGEAGISLVQSSTITHVDQ